MSAPPSNLSISLSEKPTRHISIPDWHGHVHDLQLYGQDERGKATVLRNETRQTRHEAIIRSSWTQYANNVRLEDRLAEEQQWHQVLEHARYILNNEVSFLSEEKIDSEREIENYHRALGVVAECLLLRDRRPIGDLSYDDPYKQLQEEHRLLEFSKVELTNKCHEALDLITKGNDLSARIRDDINDKATTIDIDMKTLELNKDSPCISNKPNILRHPSKMISYDCWLQAAQNYQTEAETTSSSCTTLREALKHMKDRAKMDYLGQVETTNYALRKRLHHANQLKNELEWQRKNTLEEMARLKNEIDELKNCTAYHDARLKCAETRQEDRNMRPGDELAKDIPHDGLLEEIVELRQALRDLEEKTKNSILAYNKLEDYTVKLDLEIGSKELCIQMEMRTLDVRKNLVEHMPAIEFDKDKVLVKMEKNLAPPVIC